LTKIGTLYIEQKKEIRTEMTKLNESNGMCIGSNTTLQKVRNYMCGHWVQRDKHKQRVYGQEEQNKWRKTKMRRKENQIEWMIM